MRKCNTETAERMGPACGSDFRVPELGKELEQALAGVRQELDLERTARESGALVRRRGVRRADDLLRIVLGYSVLDWSLRLLGAWCLVLGLADLSKTALRNRLRQANVWVGRLVVLLLWQQKVLFPPPGRVRIRLVDASVISQPGSRGTDWRLHLGFDLGSAGLDWVEVTDAHGGESLTRFAFEPGDLCIADRGYAIRKEVGHVLGSGAWLLARIGWSKLPLEVAAGQPYDLIGWLRQLPPDPTALPRQAQVWVSTPQGRFELRLIARALPAPAVEEARRRLRKQAHKHGRTVDARSLLAAGCMLLVTNLPETDWPAEQVLLMYRFRWQVELAFKRLKSLLRLDALRAKDPQLAQVYLLGKLLGALLLDRIQRGLAQTYPDWFAALDRPLSLWRLTALLWDEIRTLIRGPVTLIRILSVLPRLGRFLSDEPRKRRSQRALALAVLNGLWNC